MYAIVLLLLNKTGLRPVSRPVEQGTVPPLPELVEIHGGYRDGGRVRKRGLLNKICWSPQSGDHGRTLGRSHVELGRWSFYSDRPWLRQGRGFARSP